MSKSYHNQSLNSKGIEADQNQPIFSSKNIFQNILIIAVALGEKGGKVNG